MRRLWSWDCSKPNTAVHYRERRPKLTDLTLFFHQRRVARSRTEDGEIEDRGWLDLFINEGRKKDAVD